VGHKLLSPSAGHRWTVCAGAPQYEAQFPDTSSEAADEGTALHTVTESCIRTKRSVDSFLGQTIKAGERTFLMTQERLDLVQQELDYFYSFYQPAIHELHVELKLKTKLIPESGGTADVVANEALGSLHVLDHKYGRREVSAHENIQFRIYGALSLERFPEGQDEVVLHVGQPRIDNFDCEVISTTELWEWTNDFLIPAANFAISEKPPLVAGTHCLYCKASHVCPELRKHNLETAAMDFEGIEGNRPTELTAKLLGEILNRLPALELWIKDIRASAFERAKAGFSPTGWKLVAGRTNRKWKSEDIAAKVLLEIYGNKIYSPGKLLSPAKMETMVKKVIKDTESMSIEEATEAEDKILALWVKPERYTIAKVDDKRATINSAAEDFKGVV